MNIKRTKGVTTYSDCGEQFSIKCTKKDGELFKHVAKDIIRLKGNLNAFYEAKKEGKIYVTDTDGSLLLGIYAKDLETAKEICNTYFSLSISQGEGPYNVWKYTDDAITDIMRRESGGAYSSLHIGGCVFNPYFYNPHEVSEIRKALENIMLSNIEGIKEFLGYECNIKMIPIWEK